MINYAAVDQYIENWNLADSPARKYIIQQQVEDTLDTPDCNYFRDSLGDDYCSVPHISMGLNMEPQEAEERGLIQQIRDAISEYGVCTLSWGCISRALCRALAIKTSNYLPEYKFYIGYDYLCAAFSNQISDEEIKSI